MSWYRLHSLYLGSFRYIKVHLSSFRLIWAHLRSIRIIWAPLTSCIILENLISFEPIFLIWTALGWSFRRHGELSLIYLYSWRGKEIGFTVGFCRYGNICKLKTQELQVRCKWNLHDICTTLAPFISKKRGSEWKDRWGVHPKQHQEMPWNLINLFFNVT